MARKTEQAPICDIHGEPKVKLHNQWYCKTCLYNSHLTVQAQKNAVKRWRQSEKGKVSEKTYEQGKGKAARDRYLHSDKYKAARKRYNERLKESLAITRSVRVESAKGITQVELDVPILSGLVAEIREYYDNYSKVPSVANIIQTAKRDYNTIIDEVKAKELIAIAKVKNGRQQKI
jgi:hypothetical protein